MDFFGTYFIYSRNYILLNVICVFSEVILWMFLIIVWLCRRLWL